VDDFKRSHKSSNQARTYSAEVSKICVSLIAMLLLLLMLVAAVASLWLLLSSVEHILSSLRSRRINTLVGLSGTLQNGPKPVMTNRQQRWAVAVDLGDGDEMSLLLLVVH
jgi:hypothetical protein